MKEFLLAISPVLALAVMVVHAEATGPTVQEPLGILEGVFRQENTHGIRQLASRGEKIYLSSPSLGFEDGYYSPDQVCLLFEEVFRSRVTIRFNFLKGADLRPDVSRIPAVARWTYRIGKSKDRTVEIAFTLIRRDGGWILKEVRDIP